MIGVQRVHDTRLLRDYQNPPPIRQARQDRRLTEVVIRPVIIRTIYGTPAQTAHDIRIIRGELLVPKHFAGLQIQREHRIARVGGRVGVAVAGGDIQRVSLHIDGGSGPDCRARRTKKLHAERVLLRRPWFLRDRIGFPKPLTGSRVQRYHAAAECAALVFAPCARGFFKRRYRHIDDTRMDGWRAGDAGGRMIVQLSLPQQRACRRVERIGVGAAVAKVGGVTAGIALARDHDGGAHGRIWFECPKQAAGLRVERVHFPVAAADEDAATDHRRLRVRRDRAGETESPLQIQPGDVFGRDTRRLRRLKAAVREIGAPTVPPWNLERPGKRRGCADAPAGLWRCVGGGCSHDRVSR